jgi:hypothetical protein
LSIALYHFKREQAARIVAVFTLACSGVTCLTFLFTTTGMKQFGRPWGY